MVTSLTGSRARCVSFRTRWPQSPGGLAANCCDRDMPHRRIGLGAMPMAFAGLYMHDVTDIDLMLFMLRCHHAGACGHDQNLIAAERMPSRGATLAEVHHAAVIVCGVAGRNDGLTRPGNRPGPPFDRLGAFHWDIRYVPKRDHLHDDSPLGVTGVQAIRNLRWRPRGLEAIPD